MHATVSRAVASARVAAHVAVPDHRILLLLVALLWSLMFLFCLALVAVAQLIVAKLFDVIAIQSPKLTFMDDLSLAPNDFFYCRLS